MAEQQEGASAERTSVELFAGGGGLAMAVRNAGFRPLLLNEFAKHACQTLAIKDAIPVADGESPTIPVRGQLPPLVCGDIRSLDMSYLSEAEVDILAGGPPCQPFSLGGVAKGDEDKRNMFPEMFRAIREIRPKAVICENVRGLLRHSFAPYFQYILNELSLPFEERNPKSSWQEHNDLIVKRLSQEPEGSPKRYVVKFFPVNAADFGVPQIRHRVIIVAFRADLNVDVEAFAASVQPEYSEAALHRSMRPTDDGGPGPYWVRHNKVPDHVREKVIARLPASPLMDDGLKPWRTLRDALQGYQGPDLPPLPELPDVPDDHLDRVDRKLGGFEHHIGWPDARIYNGHTPNDKDRPAKTVKAGVHGVPGGESVMLSDDLVVDPGAPGGKRYKHRYMTVRETARVMTFPDTWEASGPRGEQMRQLGNAVPVLLGEVFARAVASALEKAESQK